MMDYTALGQRIRTHRRARQMTQGELAKLAGVSASFLGHIERGTRVASIETLEQLCVALRVTPNELLGMEHMQHHGEMPERVTISVPSFLQRVADLMKNLQITE